MIIVALAALSLSVQADVAAETWRESATERGTLLSQGEPANALIQMRCVRRGVLRAYLAGLYTGEGPEPHRVAVESGRARASFRLAYGVDAEGGFSADIPATAPVMVSFAGSGRLRFQAAGAELTGDAASASEIQTISAFLARCRGQPRARTRAPHGPDAPPIVSRLI